MEPRTQTLKDENRELKARLKGLLEQARENEDKHSRMRASELRLISATDFKTFLDALLHEFREQSRLDVVGLALIDDDHEIRRHIDEEYPEAPPTLFLLNQDEAVHARLSRFYVGAFDERLHGGWFADQEDLQGVALIPLMRAERLLGRLHLGTCDPARYTENVGTYFLERLAAIAAICIENAVNNHRLKQFGITDTLTGVRNRRYFDQRLIEEVQRTQREHQPLSCLFLDIDRFKRINDNYGHPAGDRVIAEVARRAAGQLREFDVLARYGGEEFVVLLPQMQAAGAAEIAERIRHSIERDPVSYAEGTLDVTLSIGLACIEPPFAGETEQLSEQLLKRADDALLEAKESGRNRVVRAT